MLSSRQRTRQTKQRVRKAENSEGPACPSWALSSRPRTASSPATWASGDRERHESTLVSKVAHVTACGHHVTHMPAPPHTAAPPRPCPQTATVTCVLTWSHTCRTLQLFAS